DPSGSCAPLAAPCAPSQPDGDDGHTRSPRRSLAFVHECSPTPATAWRLSSPLSDSHGSHPISHMRPISLFIKAVRTSVIAACAVTTFAVAASAQARNLRDPDRLVRER